ncbi:hypothetical protein OH747_40435 (plasmid) [Streptomyces anthocyanicus]|nr:hypothetical protein OH747_40435 [Streptomyces anthocyanicus]
MAALVSCNDLGPPAASPHADGTGVFGPYIPSASADARVAQAKERLIRQCLTTYGFTPDGEVTDTSEGTVRSVLGTARTAFRPAETMLVHGFHPAPRSGPPESKAKVEPQMMLVVNGTRSDREVTVHGRAVDRFGCAGRADQVLSEGIRVPFRPTLPGAEMDAVNLVLDARRSASQRLARDPSADRLRKAWADCFAEESGDSGHGYADPAALAGDVKWMRSEVVTDEETGAAVASRRCQERLGYPKKMGRLTTAHEREAESAHRDDLKAAWKVFEGRIRNAGCVLESKSLAPCGA